MNILKTLLVVPLVGLMTMPAYAHEKNHEGHTRFDQRMEMQQSRIRQGVKSGELTRHEASKLRDQQKRIAVTAREFKRDDGKLDRHERQKLEKKQDKASKHIYKLKHNQHSGNKYGHGSHGSHHAYKTHKPYYEPAYHYHDHDYGWYSLGGGLHEDGWALLFSLTDHF